MSENDKITDDGNTALTRLSATYCSALFDLATKLGARAIALDHLAEKNKCIITDAEAGIFRQFAEELIEVANDFSDPATGRNETELSNAPAPASFIAEVLRRDEAAVDELKSLMPDYTPPAEYTELHTRGKEALVTLDEMTSLLRSAICIAEREGSETNWMGFAASIRKLGLSGVTARNYRQANTAIEARREADAEALAVIEAIEERYIDGCDTYEDWRFMGQAARDYLLPPNTERGEG